VTSKSKERIAVTNKGWSGVPNFCKGRNMEGPWTEI